MTIGQLSNFAQFLVFNIFEILLHALLLFWLPVPVWCGPDNLVTEVV